MSIDQIIEQKISEQVSLALDARFDELSQVICNKLSTPKFEDWGRYLSPRQAMIYTGYSSINGFNDMCTMKGISTSRINARVLRYDRYDLDKINVAKAVKAYSKSLKS